MSGAVGVVAPRRIVFGERIATGGMAEVLLARTSTRSGGHRLLAVKRLHPRLAADPVARAMLLEEGRLAARVRHPNVVETLEVREEGGVAFVIMGYVDGEALAGLVEARAVEGGRLPTAVAVAVAGDVLQGLHAAHEAVGEDGAPLGIVHGDVSPKNVVVGVDGSARLLDFGVATSARGGAPAGAYGAVAYLAPERLEGGAVDRRADVYAVGVWLWELLTGTRLFGGGSEAATMSRVATLAVPPPGARASGVAPPSLDAIVLRALDRSPDRRFPTALAMADALASARPRATHARVAAWVRAVRLRATKQR